MGPLKGVKVIEIAGIGPGPFAGMMLADMGADVVSVERASDPDKKRLPDCNRRGKRSVSLNLKTQEGVETLLAMVEQADVLFEGFRPGVMERLGVGPDICLEKNPKLVYGRVTGWGQYGPLAKAAGHDINYISLTGVLGAIGRENDNPIPPLNLVGDYGGGAMFLVTGILAALYEAERSGKGQVVDAAMTDGSAVLMSPFNYLHAMGQWDRKRGTNMLDGGAHFYNTYETADGKYLSIGSIEPQFYALLVEKAGLDEEAYRDQNNREAWPEMKKSLSEVFKSKTLSQWCELMEGTDVCFAPILDFIEAQEHPHNLARETYIELDGIQQPAPAPRFSRTASEVQFGSHALGEDTRSVLEEFGFSGDDIDSLKEKGAIR